MYTDSTYVLHTFFMGHPVQLDAMGKVLRELSVRHETIYEYYFALHISRRKLLYWILFLYKVLAPSYGRENACW